MAPHEPDSTGMGSGSERLYEYVFSCPSSLNLAFAAWLIDDYTQKEPLGKVRVRLKELNIKAVKNLSGYHTFSGLPRGRYTLIVESEFYFPGERMVDTSSYADSKDPVVEILLRPRPLYPFPGRATLLRGMLGAEGSLPEGVKVKVKGRDVQALPDERGEFVLYFKEIIRGKENLTLEIEFGKSVKTLEAAVEEGRSTSIGNILLP